MNDRCDSGKARKDGVADPVVPVSGPEAPGLLLIERQRGPMNDSFTRTSTRNATNTSVMDRSKTFYFILRAERPGVNLPHQTLSGPC